MLSKRRIAFVTTARSDYNTMYPVMRQASDDSAVEEQIFCAGMHTVAKFGNTWKQLESDGLNICEKVVYLNYDDDQYAFSDELGKGVIAFTEAFKKHRPDIICVSGDRIENMSLYVAATSLKIPIAHMCGGDITEGAVDNQIRHMMTKLSHIHFVSMPEHARRVIQMGEEPWRVVLTGDAAVDVIVNREKRDRQWLESFLGLNNNEAFIVTTYHPQTLGEDTSLEQYANLLVVLCGLQERPVMIYPNIDPGFKALVDMLENFKQRRPDAIQCKSFDRNAFYCLMDYAEFMIGNSSSGLWEAPSFGLPAINIGDRQAGRVRGDNVIDVTGLSIDELQSAVAKARDTSFKKSLQDMANPYGEGKAAKLTVDTLRDIPLDDKLLVKKFYEIDLDPMTLGINKGGY